MYVLRSGTVINRIILVAFVLVAFAANSLLCRIALGGQLIDPVSFTSLRLASGALLLVVLSAHWPEGADSERHAARPAPGSWASGFALFAYAAAFSLAYVSLDAGVGALILFGSVQVTMIAVAFAAGERLSLLQWVGWVAALGGLAYLALPGSAAPNLMGALLMCVAGIAWGVYSVRGKRVSRPVAMTAGNFARATPMALLASVIALKTLHLQPMGIVLALVSGTITSGLGYVLWYRALPWLSTMQASVLQLTVPVIAAAGGILLLGEQVSSRLLLSGAMIIGGVALVIVMPRRASAG